MADFPSFVLCVRCSTAVPADEAKGWTMLLQRRRSNFDICPKCTAIVLKVLREAPDIMEEHDVHR